MWNCILAIGIYFMIGVIVALIWWYYGNIDTVEDAVMAVMLWWAVILVEYGDKVEGFLKRIGKIRLPQRDKDKE